MASTNNTEDIQFLSELDITKIIYKAKPKTPEDKSSTLSTIYVNYMTEKKPLFLQTPPIEITHHGYTHPQYVKEESHKMSLGLPIIDEALENKLNEWNDYLKSQEFKSEFFNNAAKKYKINPIIKTNNDDDDEEKRKPPKLSVKVNMNTYNPDKDYKTKIFSGITEENEIQYDTIDDFQKIVSFRSKCIFILKVSRIWAKKSTLPEPDYGMTFKIAKVFIIKSNSSNYLKTNITLNSKYITNDILEELKSSSRNDENSSSSKKDEKSSSSKKDEKPSSSKKEDEKPSSKKEEKPSSSKKDEKPSSSKKEESDESDNDSDNESDTDDSDEPSKPQQPTVVARRVIDSDAESDDQELKPKPKAKNKSKK